MLFVFNLFGPLLFPQLSQEVAASSITPENIATLASNERIANNLNGLKYDARLAAAAQAKAYDMIEKDYWDHFGPNGETPWQFISGAGYTYVYAGENLAKGFSTAEGVHQAWMASPTHRANLLNENYRDIGVAVVEGELSGENVILVVQMFGSLTTEKPVAETVTKVPVNNPPPVTETPKTESGQIKSISIERPTDGEVITDPGLDISGSVDGYVSQIGSYDVTLTREDTEIATNSSTSSNWSVDKLSDWEEGDHNVTVFLKGKPEITDSVTFSVDSKPPLVDPDSSMTIISEENHTEILLHIEEDEVEAYLALGSETYAFTEETEGLYKVITPKIDVNGTVAGMIIVTDKHGNEVNIDVTEKLKNAELLTKVEVTNPDSILKSILGGFTSMDLRGKINLGFAMFLFVLLLVQIIVLIRKKKLQEKGGYVMTMALFLFIVLVGLFTEISGRVT